MRKGETLPPPDERMGHGKAEVVGDENDGERRDDDEKK